MNLLQRLCEAPDPKIFAEAQARLDAKTKPRRSLGRLEDLGCQLAAIYGTVDPPVPRPAVVIMAADHGVAAEGVSAYPQEVTAQMIANIASGGAACNVLARHAGARLLVVDMGTRHIGRPVDGVLNFALGPSTGNFAHGPAMSRDQAIRGIETGIRLAHDLKRDGIGLLAVGEMGIANTTAASALTAVLTGTSPEETTGRGTGIDETRRQHKASVIRRAIEVNRPDANDPLDILAKLGGFEIAGLAGLMLGAGVVPMPVVLDGFITGAAALVAAGLCPAVKHFCIAGHCSAEPGHRIVLRHLGLDPLLDLDMRLGEATGALLAVPLVIASLRILKEMATFSSAQVTDTGA